MYVLILQLCVCVYTAYFVKIKLFPFQTSVVVSNCKVNILILGIIKVESSFPTIKKKKKEKQTKKKRRKNKNFHTKPVFDKIENKIFFLSF